MKVLAILSLAVFGLAAGTIVHIATFIPLRLPEFCLLHILLFADTTLRVPVVDGGRRIWQDGHGRRDSTCLC